MSDTISSEEAERLLGDSAWIRALARSLVSDPHAADDLIQDTWLAALRQSRLTGVPGRAWLASVLRNFARRRARGEERRARRERAAAPEEALPSVAELVERTEMQRALVDRLLALEEPFRSTLMLRYVEGLEPIEIARRLGTPDGTVRWRLKAGLERIREGLRHERGSGWMQGCAVLGGMPSGAAVMMAEAGVGGLVMSIQVKVVIAVVAVVAGGFLWRELRLDQGATTDARGTSAVNADQERVASDPVGNTDPTGTPSASGTERSAIPTAPATADAVPAPGVLLYGAVFGESGEPVPAGSVRLRSDAGRGPGANISAPGSYSLVGLQPGAWTLEIDCPGYYPLTQEVKIPPDSPTWRQDLRLAPSISLAVLIETEDGTPFRDQPRGGKKSRYTHPFVIAHRTPVGPRLAGIRERTARGFGVGRYTRRDREHPMRDQPASCSGVLELREPPPLLASLVLRDAVIATQPVAVGQTEVRFTLDPEEFEARLATVRVNLVNAATGEAVTGRVRIDHPSGGVWGELGREQDTLVVKHLLPGWLQLTREGNGLESLQRYFHAASGEITDLGVIALRPRATISGKVVDEDGEPVRGLYLRCMNPQHFQHPDELDSNIGGFTDASGNFDIDEAGQGVSWLYVAGEWARQCWEVSAGSTERRHFVVRRGVPVSFRPGGEVPPDSWLLLRNAAGLPLAGRIAGEWQLRLLPGEYRLHVWQAGIEREVQRFRVGSSPETVLFRL